MKAARPIPYAELSQAQRDMVDSPDNDLRYEAVHRGYGLDRLIADPIMYIRRAVAEQGYGLETLLHDEDENVRSRIARMGYGLETLVGDPSPLVRYQVARQAWGLGALAADPDPSVRQAVTVTLLERDMTMGEWLRGNPDRCALPQYRRADACLSSESQDMRRASDALHSAPPDRQTERLER